MLAKARQILVSELALAEKTDEDKAEAILDEVLGFLISSVVSDDVGYGRVAALVPAAGRGLNASGRGPRKPFEKSPALRCWSMR